jgi:hypothetical protein
VENNSPSSPLAPTSFSFILHRANSRRWSSHLCRNFLCTWSLQTCSTFITGSSWNPAAAQEFFYYQEILLHSLYSYRSLILIRIAFSFFFAFRFCAPVLPALLLTVHFLAFTDQQQISFTMASMFSAWLAARTVPADDGTAVEGVVSIYFLQLLHNSMQLLVECNLIYNASLKSLSTIAVGSFACMTSGLSTYDVLRAYLKSFPAGL